MTPRITVFTPTYNRAYVLPQLHDSLVRQSCNSFEWVIVDDGSTDETKELISSWSTDSPFLITYVWQPNQGKHIAINTGVALSQGELFFIVDSDDYLTDDAIEKVLFFWDVNHPLDDIAGIISYRMFHNGNLVGNKLPNGVKRCKLRETSELYHSIGDKVVIYRTEVLTHYPFPQFEGEHFLGESYVYNKIDDEYDMIVLDDRLYYFAYQKDGLSQDFRRLYRENPNGFLALYEQELKYQTTCVRRIKQQAHVLCLRIRLHEPLRLLERPGAALRVFALPLSLGLYFKIFVLKVSDVKPFQGSEDGEE